MVDFGKQNPLNCRHYLTLPLQYIPHTSLQHFFSWNRYLGTDIELPYETGDVNYMTCIMRVRIFDTFTFDLLSDLVYDIK